MEVAVDTVVDAVDKPASLEESLRSAKAAAHRRQRRLQVPCVSVGVLFLCTALTLRVLLSVGDGILPLETRAFFNLFSSLSAIFLLLALLPTQEAAIHNLTLAFSLAMLSALVAAGFRNIRDLKTRQSSMCACDSPPGWYVDTSVAISCLGNTSGLQFSIRLLILWRRRAPGRCTLEVTWRIFAQTAASLAAVEFVWLVFILAIGLDGTTSYWTRSLNIVGWALVASLCSCSKLRAKLQAALAERGEQATAGLVIGAFLGNRPLPELMRSAREHFHCVSLDRVTEAMILDNKPNPELHALTEHRALGDVDAFISHSWHDSPSEKWEALQRWRARFKLENGREARVWFDKFSIDQTNIANSLAGLPFYVAGCKTFVLLNGNTYGERLWCLVELFAFIVMGRGHGQFEIETLPSCKRGLCGLDAREATCFVPEDRSRLLGIIESGVGSLEAFNDHVRDLVLHLEGGHEILKRSFDSADSDMVGQSSSVAPTTASGAGAAEPPDQEDGQLDDASVVFDDAEMFSI